MAIQRETTFECLPQPIRVGGDHAGEAVVGLVELRLFVRSDGREFGQRLVEERLGSVKVAVFHRGLDRLLQVYVLGG